MTQSGKDLLLALQDKYLRLNAEFDNFRKRSAKEKLDAINKTKGKVIEVNSHPPDPRHRCHLLGLG